MEGRAYFRSDVVEVYVEGQVTWDVEEVARAVGIDVSTAYRHLSSLEEAGLVKGVGGRKKKYSVDPLVVALASLFLQNSG